MMDWQKQLIEAPVLNHPFTGRCGTVADFLALFERQHDDAGWGEMSTWLYRMGWENGDNDLPHVAGHTVRLPELPSDHFGRASADGG